MSTPSVARALERLATPHAVLALERVGGGYAIYPNGDRRRRPLARLSASWVGELNAAGAIVARAEGEGFALTEAGRARILRTRAAAGEEYLAQHRPVIARTIVQADGALRPLRGFDPNAALRRLSSLRGPAGKPWFSDAELAAAARLRADWDTGQAGLVRGSDWTAPPRSAGGRGPGNGMEGALAFQCDARRRFTEALAKLAAPLRRVVELVCLHDEGLEAVERAEGWPVRSGKLALKLGLAQLAAC